MDNKSIKQAGDKGCGRCLIRNVLYEQISDSMFDRLEAYRKAIYEHIYKHYKEAA